MCTTIKTLLTHSNWCDGSGSGGGGAAAAARHFILICQAKFEFYLQNGEEKSTTITAIYIFGWVLGIRCVWQSVPTCTVCCQDECIECNRKNKNFNVFSMLVCANNTLYFIPICIPIASSGAVNAAKWMIACVIKEKRNFSLFKRKNRMPINFHCQWLKSKPKAKKAKVLITQLHRGRRALMQTCKSNGDGSTLKAVHHIHSDWIWVFPSIFDFLLDLFFGFMKMFFYSLLSTIIFSWRFSLFFLKFLFNFRSCYIHLFQFKEFSRLSSLQIVFSY